MITIVNNIVYICFHLILYICKNNYIMEERLLQILKHFNYTPATFADKMKVQRSGISHLISGRNKPGYDFLLTLINEFPEINVEWFISGKGSMLKKQHLTSENQTLFNDYSVKEEKITEVKAETSFTKSDNEFTNVNIRNDSKIIPVLKIILFYQDRTWQEFLPSES